MPHPPSNLGTRLRHLLQLLDGDLEQVYRDGGLPGYRPRYTPIVRALEALGPASIKAIAVHAGLTHSAVSQTVAQMVRARLLVARRGQDARERSIAMSAALQAQLPQLHAQWQATGIAAAALDRELGDRLETVVEDAIAALEGQPFAARVRTHLQNPTPRR